MPFLLGGTCHQMARRTSAPCHASQSSHQWVWYRPQLGMISSSWSCLNLNPMIFSFFLKEQLPCFFPAILFPSWDVPKRWESQHPHQKKKRTSNRCMVVSTVGTKMLKNGTCAKQQSTSAKFTVMKAWHVLFQDSPTLLSFWILEFPWLQVNSDQLYGFLLCWNRLQGIGLLDSFCWVPKQLFFIAEIDLMTSEHQHLIPKIPSWWNHPDL